MARSDMSVVTYSTIRPSTQALLNGRTVSVRPTSNSGDAHPASSKVVRASKQVRRTADLPSDA